MNKKISSYIAILRIDHWFKNIFVLPGTVIAAVLTHTSINNFICPLLLGLISTCLVASANYVINEWLDAEFDKFHPIKKNRPAVVGNLKASIVCTEYLALLIIGFSLAALISKYFFVVTVAFGVMGFLYNVRPFRTKERVYLDVLSESVNNPIRLMLGWFIVTSQYLPPSSLVFAYWMAGAFLMNTKRYAEYRFISNPELAGLYRRSFKFYTEERLLVSSLFYSMCFAFFFGVFLIKHRIELLLSLPLFAYLFTWYLYIGMKYNSPVQNPEKLYKERGILVYIAILVVVVTALFYLKIPLLHWFLENSFTY